MIEIKATQYLRLDRGDLNQILGYYILSLIGGINGNSQEKPIENIGIYYTRYGVLWKVPITDFGDAKKFEKFKNWFVEFIKKQNEKKERKWRAILEKYSNKDSLKS